MRHINAFPAFLPVEMDDLRKKIVHGIVMETFFASPIAHRKVAEVAGAEWVKYPCWIHGAQWQDGKGFKKFKFKGHTLYVHRASCEVFNGAVPTNKIVDHLCRVRGCCQPAHLEAVTHEENIKRGANQNHLLRKGALPPVTAHDVNPDIWKTPTVEQFDSEFFRRQAENREVRRYHCIESDGPLPAAPLGFAWTKVPADETGNTWVMNPVRNTHDQYQTMAEAAHDVHVPRYSERMEQAALNVQVPTGAAGPPPPSVPVFDWGSEPVIFQAPNDLTIDGVEVVKGEEVMIVGMGQDQARKAWDAQTAAMMQGRYDDLYGDHYGSKPAFNDPPKERWYQRWARKARAWLDQPLGAK